MTSRTLGFVVTTLVLVNFILISSASAENNDLQSLLDLYPETPSQASSKTDSSSLAQRAVFTASAKLKIDVVDASVPFTIVRSSNKWDYVRFKAPTVPVWVSENYINVVAGQALVRPARLNARLRPSIQAPILIGLNRGFSGEILDSKNGFAKIKAPASLVVSVVRDAKNRDLSTSVSESSSEIPNAPQKLMLPVDQNNSTGWSSTNSKQINSALNTSPESVPSSIEPDLASSVPQRGDIESHSQKTDQSVAIDRDASGAELSDDAQSSNVLLSSSNGIAPINTTIPTLTEQGHLISPGDAISLFVFGEADLSATNIRVPQSGTISLPLIGPVPVAGKTILQVENQVRDILSQGYVRNPRLSVSIFSYRPIFIRGAIRNTGSFPYSEGLTVAKAVALAGGTKNSAQTNGISVMRNGQTIESGLSIDSQYTIASGDVLSVAEELGVSEDATLFIYLHGEVASSGEYLFRRGLTVEKAIVLAGGFTLRGSKRKVNITRYNGVASNEEPTKLHSVKLHTTVEPGDVISVGARWF